MDENVRFEKTEWADDEAAIANSQAANLEKKHARGTSHRDVNTKEVSDGSSADYYILPAGAKQLQDLISHRNMNSQIGEIFRESYRYGLAAHCDQMRGAKKIQFYIKAEIARLEKLGLQ